VAITDLAPAAQTPAGTQARRMFSQQARTRMIATPGPRANQRHLRAAYRPV
jgi:hypothetical protein